MSVEATAPGAPRDGGLALPGMVNAHSHAFQRALAGHGERAGGDDSFWGWRETMYRLAARLSADDLEAIASQAYAEMLAGGFTSVAEFHYLHDAVGGASGVMSAALARAAQRTGIRLYLLPVFYARGGFGNPAAPEQRRFLHRDVDGFLRFVERLGDQVHGIAPHSLRAVPVDWFAPLVEGLDALLGPQAPVHLHISEQRGEVEACLAYHRRTPIALLFDHVEPGPRWSLVHATHASDAERTMVREARVNVVLCPITEAYLGDGLFPATGYARAGGRFAIGSDSNVRIDAIDELRWLEYGQRLDTLRRPCLATGEGLGGPLWGRVAEAGARSLAIDAGRLAPGARADLVVVDTDHPLLATLEPARALDALITAGDARLIRDVYVGGERRVAGSRHVLADEIHARFVQTVAGLALDR